MGSDQTPNQLVEAVVDGTVIRRTALPPLPAPQGVIYRRYPGLLVIPGIPPAFYYWMALREVIVYGARWIDVENSMLLMALMTAAFSAVAAIIICVKYRLGRNAAIIWAITGFLFGLTAVATLLIVRQFPVRVKCASCGKRRAVNREACEHCGTPFEKPAAQGIEVFEAALVAV